MVTASVAVQAARTAAGPRSRGWLAVATATFAIAWGGNEFTPLLVMYRTRGDFTPLAVDLLLFAYVLGIVPALLIGGPLSDRFGRRRLMLPAPALAALGSTILAAGADSEVTLAVGRVFSGLALGLAMAVGGSWIKELSSPPWDDRDAGARRVAMALVAAVLLVGAPETRAPRRNGIPAGAWSSFRCWNAISAPKRRFWLVVVPVAPWVFGAAASAYAVLPALMTQRAAAAPIAFSALLCVVTLGVGFAVQHLGRRLGGDGLRGVPIALVLLVLGMGIAAWAASVLTVWAALAAAAVLGAGYGMALLAGLQEIQSIAGPDDLAGLTAIFYGVSYLGFAVPAACAFLSQRWTWLTYPSCSRWVGSPPSGACSSCSRGRSACRQ